MDKRPSRDLILSHMENQNPNAELIKEIRDRIQFLVTVEIFFSAFIYTFYKVVGSSELVSNTNSLFWAIGVGFCILTYLMVGIASELGKNILRWVRNLISTNIACFAPLFVLMTVNIKGPLPGYYHWPFIISLIGALWLPIATFFVLCFVLDFRSIGWIREIYRKASRK